MATVSGGGRKNKLQADGGEAIVGEREQERVTEGEDPGGILEGGAGVPGQPKRTVTSAH